MIKTTHAEAARVNGFPSLAIKWEGGPDNFVAVVQSNPAVYRNGVVSVDHPLDPMDVFTDPEAETGGITVENALPAPQAAVLAYRVFSGEIDVGDSPVPLDIPDMAAAVSQLPDLV